MRNIVIEICDRSGQRIQKVRMAEAGLKLGRAWDNDVILTDHYVDADHLSLHIDDQGALILSDLDSANGTKVDSKLLLGNERSIRFGDTVKVGDTRLRFFDANTAVAETLPRSSWHLFSDRFSGLLSMLLATLLAAGLALLYNYLFATKPLKIESMMVNFGATVLYLLGWSLLLGFIAKLVRGESNFRALWVLGCFAIIIANVVTLFATLLRFNLQNSELGVWLTLLPMALLAAWLTVGVLSYVSHWGAKAKWLVGLAVAVFIVVMANSKDLQKKEYQKWSSSSNTERVTLPPAFMLRTPVSIDEYQEDTEPLFEFE